MPSWALGWMPPEIRRCQHFICSDTRVTLAAAPTSAGPPVAPSSPSLLCSYRKLTWNKKKPSWKTYSPPHILSSPNGLAHDRIHYVATGSGGEGRICAGSRAQAESLSKQLSPWRCNQNCTGQQKGWKDAPSSLGNYTSAAPRKGEFVNNVLQNIPGFTHCVKGEMSFFPREKRVECG